MSGLQRQEVICAQTGDICAIRSLYSATAEDFENQLACERVGSDQASALAFVHPLGGSYCVNSLTKALAERLEVQ